MSNDNGKKPFDLFELFDEETAGSTTPSVIKKQTENVPQANAAPSQNDDNPLVFKKKTEDDKAAFVKETAFALFDIDAEQEPPAAQKNTAAHFASQDTLLPEERAAAASPQRILPTPPPATLVGSAASTANAKQDNFFNEPVQVKTAPAPTMAGTPPPHITPSAGQPPAPPTQQPAQQQYAPPQTRMQQPAAEGFEQVHNEKQSASPQGNAFSEDMFNRQEPEHSATRRVPVQNGRKPGFENMGKAASNKKSKQQSQFSKYMLIGVMSLCAAIFVFSAVRIAMIFSSYKGGEKEYETITKDHVKRPQKQLPQNSGETYVEPDIEDVVEDFVVDFNALRQINHDYTGWIEIPGTVVSYPVVCGSDNDYYLNRTFEKASNPAGAIFMDYRNNADFSSKHTIIYGHNLRTGTMFGSLKDYLTDGYLGNHRYIYIQLENVTHKYEIVRVAQVDKYDGIYKLSFDSDEEFADFAAPLGGNGQNLITLSTCVRNKPDLRLVITAQLVEVTANNS